MPKLPLSPDNRICLEFGQSKVKCQYLLNHLSNHYENLPEATKNKLCTTRMLALLEFKELRH